MSTQAQSTMPQQIARFSTCRRPGLWRCSSERPPQLWKLRRLGAIAPEGLRTRISHVSSPEGPPLVILPQDTTHREQIQKGITQNRSKKASQKHSLQRRKSEGISISFTHTYIEVLQAL